MDTQVEAILAAHWCRCHLAVHLLSAGPHVVKHAPLKGHALEITGQVLLKEELRTIGDIKALMRAQRTSWCNLATQP